MLGFSGEWLLQVSNGPVPAKLIVTVAEHRLMVAVENLGRGSNPLERVFTISGDEDAEVSPVSSSPYWPWQPFFTFTRPDSDGYIMGLPCSVGIGIDPVRRAIVEVFYPDDAKRISVKLAEPFVIGLTQHTASCNGEQVIVRLDENNGMLYSSRRGWR